MKYARALILSLSVFLVSCSAELNDYKGTDPDFDLFSYFEGKTEAWGMVQDYTNKQTGRFYVSIDGRVDGDTLTLDERFTYHDGKKDTRVWKISRLANGHYEGTADDIIGTAEGRAVGNVFRWQYDFTLKLEGGDIDVSFDDWLYRQDENHVFNISYIKKYGATVGKVTLFFVKK
ncbi:DUF3833 domain-containing protein [Vibrio salinus]|uniref:DUF3833 domain-containing protein n=1 Tax=Vibrio salinus TaxID=2899784 RepID=UPI001E3BC1A8|nr:DUF3833 domain-containing protein [Vibrio salinus]MCE0496244.1 DUF3833 domain-containing protein [Vibrio salinus]